MVRGVSVHRASSNGKGADIGCSVGGLQVIRWASTYYCGYLNAYRRTGGLTDSDKKLFPHVVNPVPKLMNTLSECY